MIYINFAPPSETEERFWFIPDLAFASVVFAILYLGAEFYRSQAEEKIDHVRSISADYVSKLSRLNPQLKRFSELNTENLALQKKIKSLEQITVSNISRYKPIVLLEHLQNLKPTGVWYSYVGNVTNKNMLHLAGGAFDNLRIAEFISNLKSTKFQETDPSDFRTQVYFKDMHLITMGHSSGLSTTKNPPTQSLNRNSKVIEAFNKLQNTYLTKSVASNYLKATNTIFPEMKKFPIFELNIEYAEKSPPNVKIPDLKKEPNSSGKSST